MMAGAVGLDVGDDQEARAQLAVGVGQREVLLVGLHGQDQAFLRHGQEFFLELAFVDHRPFDQRGHFVEQRFGISTWSAPALASSAVRIFSRRSAKLAMTLPCAASVAA
jgi:hypothetical protein